MMRIFFFLAGFFGAGSFRAIWEGTGPSADPDGKPTDQGSVRGDDGIG